MKEVERVGESGRLGVEMVDIYVGNTSSSSSSMRYTRVYILDM